MRYVGCKTLVLKFEWNFELISVGLLCVSFVKSCPWACSLKANLYEVNFERLDFGQTEVLDRFYNADVAIVDMSIRLQQSSLFYHIGVRESMGMPETIILLHDTDPEFTLSVKVAT